MRSTKRFLAGLLVVSAVGILGAASAWAIESEWVVGGEPLSELEIEKEEVSIGGGPIAVHVPSLNLTIECEEAVGNGEILQGGLDEAMVEVSECEVAKAPLCEVVEPVIIEAKTAMIEAGGALYAKMMPLKEGKALTTISIEECALPEETKVTGAVAAEVSLEGKVEQSLTFSKEISETVNKALKEEKKEELTLLFGISKSNLIGEMAASLSGPNAEATFVRTPNTKLCKVAPTNSICPAGQHWPKGEAVKLENEGAMTFVYNGREPQCGVSKIEGTTAATEGRPLRANLSSIVFMGCTYNGKNCTVTAPDANYTSWFWRANKGGGIFDISAFSVKLVCEALTCVYVKIGGTEFGVTGNNPAKAKLTSVLLFKDGARSDAFCEKTAFWKGEGGEVKYKFAKPIPMFLAS